MNVKQPRPLRVGLVGAGMMGNHHAADLMRMPGVELAGVFDINSSAVCRTSQRFGVPGYSDVDALLRDVDAVDICLPTHFHKELAIRSCEAGRHVLCEKPMARTVEECKEMINAASRHGVTLMPAQTMRFFPGFEKAREMIRNGAIGNPCLAHTRRIGAAPGSRNGWYSDLSLSGGVILDLCIHDVDWLRWTFGEVERVYARSAAVAGWSGLDYALITLRFFSGVIAHIEGSWAEAAGFEYDFEICGDKGILSFSDKECATVTVGKRENDGRSSVRKFSPHGPDKRFRQIQHFVESIRAGTPLVVTPEDGLKAVEICTAALESASTGKPVFLGETQR